MYIRVVSSKNLIGRPGSKVVLKIGVSKSSKLSSRAVPGMIPIAKIESKPAERRRHNRVKVVLLGRYMLSDRHEYPCQTVDMSPGGLGLIAPVPGNVGERVVCYVDQIGRVEGVIARLLPSGFAIAVNVPILKREKLAEQLTWLANRHALGMAEDRRHERILPRNIRTTLVLPNGVEFRAKIIDVSRSGVALGVPKPMQLGTAVTVGKTPGKVVRSFNEGIGVEFSRIFPIEEFHDEIVL